MPSEVARRWNRALTISLSCVGRSRHHFVVYEELARDPHHIAESLAKSLLLSDAPGFSGAYKNVATNITLPFESHKQKNTDNITLSTGTGESHDSKMIEEIERIARNDLYLHYCKMKDIFTNIKGP